jgi:hypothetical protein
VFAVAPSLTFEALAEAINRAFGRWTSRICIAFALDDGRRIGLAEVAEGGWIDHGTARLGSTLKPGERAA